MKVEPLPISPGSHALRGSYPRYPALLTLMYTQSVMCERSNGYHWNEVRMLGVPVFNPTRYIRFGDLPGWSGCEGEEKIPDFAVCTPGVGRRFGCMPRRLDGLLLLHLDHLQFKFKGNSLYLRGRKLRILTKRSVYKTLYSRFSINTKFGLPIDNINTNYIYNY